MVFFSCDGCGETLKKSQVDSHAHRCHSCASVSCMDCNVSFWGDTYRLHTSCLTEAERYEKSVYRGPKKGASNIKKGPQDVWSDLIVHASEIATDSIIKSKLKELTHLSNVPRKEKQFRNFTANSLKLRDYGNHTTNSQIVDRMWKYLVEVRDKEYEKRKRELEERKGDPTPPPQPQPQPTKELPTENSRIAADENVISKKKVLKAMKKMLKKAPKHQLKMKELRGKVETKLNVTKCMQKELKKIIMEQIGEHDKKLKLDGKFVSLIAVS